MQPRSSDSPISRTLRPLVGLFGPPFGQLFTLQAHSSRSCLNNSFSHPSQVALRKQRDQLRRVFEQAPLPSLTIAKLAFDHPKEVVHFGPNAGFDFFQLVDQGAYIFALLQRLGLTGHHGNLPVHPRVLRLNLFALGDAAVGGVCEYNSLFNVQQCMRLCDVVLIGSSARDRMNQARLSVFANVRLHTEVPLVAFLGLMHFWVTLTRAVLGEAGSCDPSGINDCACFKQQAPVDQLGVNGGKNLKSQVVGVKQVNESENGALIRQPKLLHHEMKAKNCGNSERRTDRFACRRKGGIKPFKSDGARRWFGSSRYNF